MNPSAQEFISSVPQLNQIIEDIDAVIRSILENPINRSEEVLARNALETLGQMKQQKMSQLAALQRAGNRRKQSRKKQSRKKQKRAF
jgi:hypothetical protein